MDVTFETAIELLLRAGRLGQKTATVFTNIRPMRKAARAKEIDPETERLLAAGQPNGKTGFGEEDIVARMMLPLILEARVASRMASPLRRGCRLCLILGLGLPRYLGGALKYADYLGLKTVVESAGKRESLGPSTAERALAGQGGHGGSFLSL